MSKLLSSLVWFFGAICIAIALVHIGFGPRSIPGSVPVNATMDSEDRFYATLFLGFGSAMIFCSRDLAGRENLFAGLLLTFFFGGVARIVSAVSVGLPNALFTFLGALELLLPPLLWWWHRALCARVAA